MMETRPLLSMFLTALLVASLSGCDGVDNPLRWEESPVADDLIGTWKVVEGPDTGVRARVSRKDNEMLGFELTYPENTKGTLQVGQYKQRATFLGEVLGSGALHVLQVRMDSYDEFDEDGESLWDPATGFLFWRIAPSPENGVHVHRLNPEVLGRVAEEELAATGLKIQGEAFAYCLSDDIRSSLRTRVWIDIREGLDDELLAEVQDALGLDQREVAEIQRQSAKLAELKVDPYEELSGIRTCVAARLPSESLERVFLLQADRVFSDETDRYVRE